MHYFIFLTYINALVQNRKKNTYFGENILLFQITKLDTIPNIVNFALWGTAYLLFACYSTYIFIKYVKYRKVYNTIQKENVFTWGLFFFFLCAATLESILWRFFLTDNNMIVSFYQLSVLLTFICMIIKTINIERGINKSELYHGYYFSPISIIASAISAIYAYFPIPWLITVIYICIFTGWGLMPLIFIYLGIKTIGKTRKNCFIIAAGSLLNMFGLFLLPAPDFNASIISIEGLIMQLSNYELILDILLLVSPSISILGTSLIFIGSKPSTNLIE